MLAPFIHVLVKLLYSLVQASVMSIDATEIAAAAMLQDFARGALRTDEAPGYTSAVLDMAYRLRDKLHPLAIALLT